MPGVGDDGDDPVSGDPPGHAPPPGGASTVLGRLHVLPGDQRQQGDCPGRVRGQFPLGQVAQQSVRVAGQRADQIGAGLGVVLGDRRLAGLVVVVPGAVRRDHRGGTGGTSRATRRIAAISRITVSCVATASVTTVEFSTRRVLPDNAPVVGTTSRAASKTRFGRAEAASRRRQ